MKKGRKPTKSRHYHSNEEWKNKDESKVGEVQTNQQTDDKKPDDKKINGDSILKQQTYQTKPMCSYAI